EKAGGTFILKKSTPLGTKGELADFRPFSLAVDSDRARIWLVDWAFDGWLAEGPKTGRLYRLRYEGSDRVTPAPAPQGDAPASLFAALDHPALSVRMAAQRSLSRRGVTEVSALAVRLKASEPGPGRLHALWALDAIGTDDARRAIRAALADRDAEVRLQAARSAGIRRDRGSLDALCTLLRDADAAGRREAAIALGRLDDAKAVPALMAALGDSDKFASWSIRHAIRTLGYWDQEALVKVLLDDRCRDDALALCDEAWSVTVVRALAQAFARTESAPVR